MRLASRLALLGVAIAASANAAPKPTEATLRAADALQRELISQRDAIGMRRLAHPNLHINAPTNVVLSRDQLLSMMGNGQIAAEDFVRVPESVTITANVGVVMGHETFTSVAGSASANMFGTRPLNRRYTNVYIFEGGRWRFLARHANVIRDSGATQTRR